MIALSIVAGLVLLISWVISHDEEIPSGSRKFWGGLLNLFACGVVFLSGIFAGAGETAEISDLDNNGIYEVVGATPVDGNQWIILRDQDGCCLTYKWKGAPPVGIVKAVKQAKGSPNRYTLVPFPTTTTQPTK